MAVIDSVFDEILLYIFRIHVFRNQDTPHRLLRVSKWWYGLTTGNGSLWGNMLFSNHNGPVDDADRHRILCMNPQALELAIERTGNSPFELEVSLFQASEATSLDRFSLNGFNAIQAAISQRCRALTFRFKDSIFMMKDITSLTALERLSITYAGPGISDGMKRLLGVVTRTAKNLRCLGVYQSGDSILPYSGIISRLKSAHFTTIAAIGPEEKIISGAPNLEQLCLYDMNGQGPLFQLGTPLPSLQRLEILHPYFDKIPWVQYTRLTHLWITMDYSSSILLSPTRTFTFPTLYHLMLEGPWSILRCINAPVLESLVLEDRQEDQAQALSAIEATSLQPRSLDIDYISENGIIDILRGKWKNIEILRLLARWSIKDGIGESLVNSFTNDSSFCANLLELMVRCPRQKAREVRLELMKIASARSRGTVLKRVQYTTSASLDIRPRSWHGSSEENLKWTDIMADEGYSTPSFRHSDSCHEGCHRG